jgi:hypothetical protein
MDLKTKIAGVPPSNWIIIAIATGLYATSMILTYFAVVSTRMGTECNPFMNSALQHYGMMTPFVAIVFLPVVLYFMAYMFNNGKTNNPTAAIVFLIFATAIISLDTVNDISQLLNSHIAVYTYTIFKTVYTTAHLNWRC